MEGHGVVKKQFAGRGQYGEVRLNCRKGRFTGAPGFEINVRTELAKELAGWKDGIEFAGWREAIVFGVNYFLKHAGAAQLEIEILELRYTHADTNMDAMAFATVLALCDAFEMELGKMPFFDRDSKKIIFPE